MSKGRGYTILIKRSAEKEMDRLPVRTFERVAQAIVKLERDPRPKRSKKLRGLQDYRLRVGEYRVLVSRWGSDSARTDVSRFAVLHQPGYYVARVARA